ncbi:MAG: hypothetical protein ACJ71P_13860 [Nitrososphaeraceae archaeon]
MKLDLLTNATVVDDAIRFVSIRSKYDEKLKSANGKGDGEESEEPNYDEEQEEEAEEITSATITTNQVF